MRRFLAILLATASSASAAGPRALNAKDEALLAKLEARLAALDRDFDGALGIAILDLASGRTILRNPDELFPTASIIKVAVLAELFHQEQQGEAGASGTARLADLYVPEAKDIVAESAMLAGMTPGVTRLTNRDLATFMIGVSDNGATNVLIDRLGMDNVNGFLARAGLKETRLRRKMMDIEAAKSGRENTTTPRELMSLLAKLQGGELLDAPHTAGLLAALATPKESYLHLAAGIHLATKTGSLEGVRGEAGIVRATHRPFVVVILIALAGEERRAEGLIAEIGALALETFDRIGRATPLGRVLYPRGEESP